jgi:hypothetical protein
VVYNNFHQTEQQDTFVWSAVCFSTSVFPPDWEQFNYQGALQPVQCTTYIYYFFAISRQEQQTIAGDCGYVCVCAYVILQYRVCSYCVEFTKNSYADDIICENVLCSTSTNLLNRALYSILYTAVLLSVTECISLWTPILACANCSTEETVELCPFIYFIGWI